MIRYEVLHSNDEYLIQGNEDNHYWLVQAVFEKDEGSYAEAVCNILNEEVKRAYDQGYFAARREIQDGKKR